MRVDVDITLGKTKPKPPLVSSRVALAGVAVEQALGAAGRRMLQRGRGEILVLAVPALEWVESAMTSCRLLAPKALVVSKSKGNDVAVALAEGRTVLGVSPAPGKELGTLFRDAPRFTIGPPTPELLRHAMKRSLVGRAPADLRRLDIAEVDFDRLCAAMPLGTSKARAVQRLKRLEAPSSTTGRELPMPRLVDAVEYGDARLWGLELASDFADLKAGRIGWRDAHRGAVLVSDPGVGKSTFSRILAKACGVPLVTTSISELFATKSGHLGDVVRNLRHSFDEARSKAPCILFLDELGAVPRLSRLDGSRNADFWRPVVHEFYLQLDSAMHDRTGVVVIGATNEPGLDPALTRPGRLEKVIHIDRPDAKGLANILRTQLGDDLPDIDLLPLAAAAGDTTAAVAMDWVRSARRVARAEMRSMRLADLELQVFTPDTRSATAIMRAAIHEAGHAIVGRELGLEPISVSIQRIGQSGGRTRFAGPGPNSIEHDASAKVRMILAGRAAEQEICASASTGAGGGEDSDLAMATAIVAQMHVAYGLGSSLTWRCPPSEAGKLLQHDPQLREAVERDLQLLFVDTLNLVRDQRSAIEALAARLVDVKSVSGQEVGSGPRSSHACDAPSRLPTPHPLARGSSPQCRDEPRR